jgi:hypothetical protein
MITKSDGIRFIDGSGHILVIAPHGPFIDGAYQNDLRTGVIAEEIQHRLKCTAVINDRFFKPKGPIKKDAANYYLDVYRIDHAAKVPGYLDGIRDIVDAPGKTMVLWVHGIADDVALRQGEDHVARGLFSGEPDALHALIGFGQGKDPKKGDPKNRLSARTQTVEIFRDALTRGGLTTLLTHPEGSNFRGRDEKRLNQWFNHLGYGVDRVESIQLEIREKGFRDSQANALKTAGIIAEALRDIALP